MNEQVQSRWKPGQSGNLLGRPQGSRSKFSETAMAHLLDDWTANGPAVLAKVRQEDPSTYLRVAFPTIPKDVQIAIENRGPMDSEEMRGLRRLVDVISSSAPSEAERDEVFAVIEEALRAHFAKPVHSEGVA